MTLDERNRLFNAAYGLDNLPRVYVPKNSKPYKAMTEAKLEKARMQEKTERVYVLVHEDVLSNVAQTIRDIAANDEDRVVLRIRGEIR